MSSVASALPGALPLNSGACSRASGRLPQRSTTSWRGSAIKDDLLRMMFSCCHPRLGEDAQVALVLHIVCGFASDEIAAAFLTTNAAMHKRISRAKKVLAGSKRLFDLSDADFAARLSTVQRALYLLFNEGYHGSSAEAVVRADLCREAIRLMMLLVEFAFGA